MQSEPAKPHGRSSVRGPSFAHHRGGRGLDSALAIGEALWVARRVAARPLLAWGSGQLVHRKGWSPIPWQLGPSQRPPRLAFGKFCGVGGILPLRGVRPPLASPGHKERGSSSPGAAAMASHT